MQTKHIVSGLLKTSLSELIVETSSGGSVYAGSIMLKNTSRFDARFAFCSDSVIVVVKKLSLLTEDKLHKTR